MSDWVLEYADDAGNWSAVSSATNGLVPSGPIFHDRHYEYNLALMQQTNRRSGFVRPLRLRPSATAAAPDFKWCFESMANQFEESEPLTAAVHALTLSNIGSSAFMCDFFINMAGARYQVQVSGSNGTQTNVNTGVTRNIAKKSVASEQLPSYDLCTHIEEAPDELCCPITSLLMTRPMRTTDGHVYEHAAIARWFARNDKSPMTGLALIDKTLTLDTPTLIKLAQFRKTHQGI